MAGPPTRSGGDDFDEPIALLRPSTRWKVRDFLLPAVITGGVAIVCLIVVHYALPKELSALWQRLTGLAMAGLVTAGFAWSTRQAESDEEFIHRIRSGQHSDFGKRLRKNQPKPLTLKLPLLGATSVRAIIGTCLFAVLAGWWLTPLAPVGVKKRQLEDLIGPLADEVMAVVLVMPDVSVATLQPPTPSLRARKLAAEIPEDANAYHRALKAIAERRFGDARPLLALAMRNDDAEALQIRLARALVEMYAGQYVDAAQWYGEVLLDEPDNPTFLCQLSVAWMQAYQFGKAEPLLYQAARVCLEMPPEQRDPLLSVCYHLQGVLCIGQGKGYQEAETKCTQAHDLFEKTRGPQDVFVAASLSNHATLYMLQAKYPGAQGLMQRAHSIWSRALGSNDPHLLASLGNLAMLDCALGQYDDAQGLLEQARDIRPEGLPEDHPILAIPRNQTAVFERGVGRYAAAQQSAEMALASCEKALGPDHPDVAAIVDTLAMTYADQARQAKADLYFLRAAVATEKVWGPNHPYLAVVRNQLAEFYLQEGRDADAEPLCQQALETSKAVFGEKHPSVADALSTCGKLKMAQGDLRAARTDFQTALAIRQEVFGESHPQVASSMGDLAALCGNPGDYAKGLALYQRAIEMTDQRLGLDHPQVARLLLGLAALYIGQGKYAEAEPCLKRALAVEEATLVPFHLDLADTLDAYANLLLKLRPSDANRAAAMKKRAALIRENHREEDQTQ